MYNSNRGGASRPQNKSYFGGDPAQRGFGAPRRFGARSNSSGASRGSYRGQGGNRGCYSSESSQGGQQTGLSSYGPSRGYGGGSRGGYGGPRRSNKPSFRERIDERMFVKKAEPVKKIEDVATKHSFEDFGLNEQLISNIKSKGFVKPTPIQDQVIEEVMKGRDVLGIANTGTGKTAAFAIPIINRILNNPNERIIILAPTRELAQQIKEEFRTFTPGLRVYIALAIGGAYMREQIMDIKRGPNIIIGTPGRITDLGRKKVIDFAGMNMVVLDEVDRMLDMGFVDEIKSIMERIPASRQTLFFSATVNRKIETLIDTLLNNPVKVSVKTQD